VARLRAVAVAMPQLLADMFRHALGSRTDVEMVAEIAASPNLVERLQALDPDLVIISETSAAGVPTSTTVAAVLKRARVIVLSRDVRFIFDAAEKRELTVDTLAALLQ